MPVGVSTGAIRQWLSPPTAVDQHRYAVIDGTRCLAALAVLFAHYKLFFLPQGIPDVRAATLPLRPLGAIFGPVYYYGGYSVPLFWVISGFVFSSVYIHSRATTDEFVLNRFSRLYPLHLLTLLVIAALQIVAWHQFGHWLIDQNNDLHHFVRQLTFSSNWGGLEEGVSFNGVIWSVSVEVLVYAAFWVVRRRLFTWGLGSALPLMLLLGFLQKRSCLPGVIPCSICFFGGACVYFTHRRTRQSPFWGCLIAAVLIATGIACLAVPALYRIAWPLALASLLCGVVLLLAVAEPLARGRGRRMLIAMGDTSYGIYLWHTPIQVTIVLVLMLTYSGTVPALAESPWFLAGFTLVSCVAARISFLTFERPMRQRLRGRVRAGVPGPAIAGP